MILFKSPWLLLALVAVAHATMPASFTQLKKRMSVNPQKLLNHRASRMKTKLRRASKAGAQGSSLQSTAISSTQYMAMTMHGDESCTADSAFLSFVLRTGECHRAGSQGSGGLFCVPGEGLGLYLFAGTGCKSQNLVEVWPFINMTDSTCFGPDDDDWAGDDDWTDDSIPAMGISMECTDHINEVFEDEPVMGIYEGTKCKGNWMAATFFRTAQCQDMGNSSYSTSCGGGELVSSYYPSTECLGVAETTLMPTGQCMAHEDDDFFDDDDHDDDDHDDDDHDDDADDDDNDVAAAVVDDDDDFFDDDFDDDFFDDDFFDDDDFMQSSAYVACTLSSLPDSAVSAFAAINWVLALAAAFVSMSLAIF